MSKIITCKKEGCNKSMRLGVLGYCRYHYLINWKKEKQERLKEEDMCISCGNRKAQKVVCPHCDGLIKYMTRCEECRKKQKEYQLRNRKK